MHWAFVIVYRLSPSYTNDASPYLIVKATTLPATCRAMTHNVKVGSLRGPNRTRIKVGSVKLVADFIVPVSGSVSRRVRPRKASSRSMRRVRNGGGAAKGTTEGKSVSVSASYLYTRQRSSSQPCHDSLWNSMSRTWYESKQLRTTEQKVEDLGDEEEKKRFGVVALDGDDGERHAGEVAESVSGERSSGVPYRIVSEMNLILEGTYQL
jgi:hypothetical protein